MGGHIFQIIFVWNNKLRALPLSYTRTIISIHLTTNDKLCALTIRQLAESCGSKKEKVLQQYLFLEYINTTIIQPFPPEPELSDIQDKRTHPIKPITIKEKISSRVKFHESHK